MRRLGIVVAGLALAVIGVAGVVHGVRAELAQLLYFQCKYGPWKADPDRAFVAAERAHGFYPYNDLLCILTAETAWYTRVDEAGGERVDRLDTAARWCAAGQALNPWSSQLRMLDMRLTERHSLREAVRKWEAFVDWQYWEPYNHVVMVELYGKAGRYREALERLALLESRPPFYQDAQRALNDAWRAEISGVEGVRGR